MPYVLGTIRLEDRAGNTFNGGLGGIYGDTVEQVQHDMYAYDGHSPFVAGDEKIGAYIIDDTYSPSVTWTLQRRRPHAEIDVLSDSTQEGDSSNSAKLWFRRDDRITEKLTLHFSLTFGPYLSTGDFTAIAKIPDGNGNFSDQPIDLNQGTIEIPGYSLAANVTGIEVDITATDDTTPEWTEGSSVRLDDDSTYVADHPNDTDGLDTDGVLGDVDPDAAVLLKDNDLSFDLQQGTLVANYNDTNNDNVTDYLESGSQGGDGGDDPDLYPMQLNVPRIDKTGASVTLTIPADFFNVYTANAKGEPLAPDNPGGSTYTWNGNASQIPQTLWLEVKKGSSTINDITCELSSNDNGASPPPFSQQNTAVNFEIDSLSDPNGDGGGDVKNKNRPWLVGQVVDQFVNIQCPPEWRQNPTYQWTVGNTGNTLFNYLQDSGTAATFPITDNSGGGPNGAATGFKQSEIKFFWVSTAAEGIPDDNSVPVQVGNINGQSYSVSSNYQVHSPNSAATATMGTAVINAAVTKVGLVGPPPGVVGGGINFQGSVTTPTEFASGEWSFLQTVDTVRQYWDSSSSWNPFHWSMNGLWALDSNPYPAPPEDPFNSGSGWIADGAPHITRDSPAKGLANTNQDLLNDAFHTFLMFRPPGTGSEWVPLRVLDWAFDIVAKKTNNVWAVFGTPHQSMTPANGVFTPQATEPIWNQSVANGSWLPGL